MSTRFWLILDSNYAFNSALLIFIVMPINCVVITNVAGPYLIHFIEFFFHEMKIFEQINEVLPKWKYRRSNLYPLTLEINIGLNIDGLHAA